MTAINDEVKFNTKVSYPWWHQKLCELANEGDVELEVYKYYYLPYYAAGFTPEETIKGLSDV